MAAAQMHALATVRREIHSRDNSHRCKYLRDYNNSFRKYDYTLSAQELEKRIAAASLLLVGDYHALPASQRFASSLVERIAQRSKVVLGVEAVLSRDQAQLDAWWRREISEAALREKLRFDREWGYDWQPFYELLAGTRDHGDGIYGLDCAPRDDLRSIRSRDRHAAEKIREMRNRHPDALILVLFGESHMAPQHLPALLQDKLLNERCLTVLQNIDSLYWDAMGQQAQAVSLSDDAVCVFNCSPLEKYESYRLCLERWNSAPSDDLPDYTPAVHNLIFSLARSLGFRLDSPHNGTQPKFLADSLPEVVSVNEKAEVLQEFTSECSYVPQTNTVFIREFNMFAVAAEATRFLHYACAGKIGQSSTNPKAEEILAHFGARLLCPGTSGNHGGGDSGQELYERYLAGEITTAAIRRMFLGHDQSSVDKARERA